MKWGCSVYWHGMPTRGVLLMLILAEPTRAAFSMDITICDNQANQIWKKEAPKIRDDVLFIHECRIYSGKTSTQNVLTQCIKNVEAHITIPGSSKTLHADFLSEELEWCTVKEVLVSEGDGLIVKQSFICHAYSPSAQDEFRAYLSCDPHFGHPVVILLLRPMRKVVIFPYIEAFFYGWCSSIAISAAILLLIIAYKPELVEIIHKQGFEHVKSRKKHTSRENALAAAKLEARKKLLNSPRTSAGSSAKKQKPERSTSAESKEKGKKYSVYSETKAKYLSLKRKKKLDKKKAEKK
ncbi:unnamed protein product [Cylicocyclus nassatus]|uniref:Uncharacterized protein n=1 Tax=Cylicocyclus nassatus TaxID=53992 RepID=A0AA36GZA3_CYLNA|nr:unnamed protein product [Cylicocyclus nassatus]